MNLSVIKDKLSVAIEKIKCLDPKIATPICLSLLFLASTALRNDFDCFFIIENGKYIVENQSLPHEDWMSMHDGFHIVLQQWLFSTLVYLVYANFGWIGLYVLMVTASFALYTMIFKVCMLRTNDEWFSSLIISIISCVMISWHAATIRPSIFSLLFLTTTIFLLEKSRNNKLIVYLLPIVSLLQSNTHSTFWIAVVGTIVVFTLFNRNKHLIIAAVLSIAAGFLNPYGYEAVFQVFYTIGYSGYKHVSELMPLSGTMLILLMTIPMILIAYNIVKKGVNKTQAPYLILLIITFVATLSALRSVVFFAVIFAAFMSGYYMKEESVVIDDKNKNKYLIIVVMILVVSTTFIGRYATHIDPLSLNRDENNAEIADVVNNYFKSNEISGDLNGETIFSDDIQIGQVMYHEFGTRAYVDGRLETFIDSLNKKENIFGEFIEVIYGQYYFNDFIDKYNFDYVVTQRDRSSIPTSVSHCDKYELVYQSDLKDGYDVYKKIDY